MCFGKSFPSIFLQLLCHFSLLWKLQLFCFTTNICPLIALFVKTIILCLPFDRSEFIFCCTIFSIFEMITFWLMAMNSQIRYLFCVWCDQKSQLENNNSKFNLRINPETLSYYAPICECRIVLLWPISSKKDYCEPVKIAVATLMMQTAKQQLYLSSKTLSLTRRLHRIL